MDTFCVCRFDDDGHPNVGMPCFSTTASATCILADMMYSHTQGTKPEVCYCVWSQIFEVTALTALPLGCSPCHKNCLVQKLTISVHQSTIKKNVSYQGHCKPQKMPRPLQATKDVNAIASHKRCQGHCEPQKMPRPLQATKDVKAIASHKRCQGHCKPQKIPRPLQATKDTKAIASHKRRQAIASHKRCQGHCKPQKMPRPSQATKDVRPLQATKNTMAIASHKRCQGHCKPQSLVCAIILCSHSFHIPSLTCAIILCSHSFHILSLSHGNFFVSTLTLNALDSASKI